MAEELVSFQIHSTITTVYIPSSRVQTVPSIPVHHSPAINPCYIRLIGCSYQRRFMRAFPLTEKIFFIIIKVKLG